MHPSNKFERRLIDKKKSYKLKKGDVMKDAIVRTVEGGVAVEMKTMPDTMECGACGGTLEFISIEDGYSCQNEDCILHFDSLEEEEVNEQAR